MYYSEILEMKPSKINPSKERTFGFEAEVMTENYGISDEKINELLNVIKNNIEGNYSIDDFLKESYDLKDMLEKSGSKPKYGWVSKKEYYKNKEENNPEPYKKLRNAFEYKKNNFNNTKNNKKILIDLVTAIREINFPGLDDVVETIESKYSDSPKDDIDHDVMAYYEQAKDLLPEYYDENEKSRFYIYDEDENFVHLDNINFNDLDEYFENSDELKNEIIDRYDDYLLDVANEYLKHGNLEDYGIDSPYEFAIQELKKYVDGDIYIESTGNKNWSIVSDSSLGNYGFEVVSPVFNNMEDGIDNLKSVLKFIRDNNDFYTNEKTGLHINIGNIDKDNIDWFKFLIILGEKHLLKVFDRIDNLHTEEILTELSTQVELKKFNTVQYNKAIKKLNKIILDEIPHQSKFLNFFKLEKGYIEIRGMGGNDYETKENQIINFVKKIYYCLDIAEDPNAYRQEYLKKLGKFLNVSYKTKDSDNPNISAYGLSQKEIEKLLNFVNYYRTNDKSYKHDIVYVLNNYHRDFNSLNNIANIIFDSSEHRASIPNELYRIVYKLFNNAIKNNPSIKDRLQSTLTTIEKMVLDDPEDNDLFQYIKQRFKPNE